MAKGLVYRSFEVREGFGPGAFGPLRFSSAARGEADVALEDLAVHGISAQLFGIRTDDDPDAGERVLLRALVGRLAA